ncbi:MAG: hypothetical protein Q4G18_07395 [Myroides sp.]|nr:hypothetical protein [Myroides sp.]
MTLEELNNLFKFDHKDKSPQLLTLEKYFPYFDKELRKTGVTQRTALAGILHQTSRWL